MFTSSLAEEAKALQEDVNAVSEKIEDPVLCEKIRLYVYAPREIQDFYKAEAGSYLISPRAHLKETCLLQRQRVQIF